MPNANQQIILAFIEDVLNEARWERLNDLVLENFVELDPLPGQLQGREGLKGALVQFKAAFPDIHWQVSEQICEGDKVVSRFTWTGTHRDTFLGIPATGRHVEVKSSGADRPASVRQDGRQPHPHGHVEHDAAARRDPHRRLKLVRRQLVAPRP